MLNTTEGILVESMYLQRVEMLNSSKVLRYTIETQPVPITCFVEMLYPIMSAGG